MDNKTSEVTEVSNPKTRETKILKQKLNCQNFRQWNILNMKTCNLKTQIEQITIYCHHLIPPRKTKPN